MKKTLVLCIMLTPAVSQAGSVGSRHQGANKVQKGLNEVGIHALGSLSQVTQDENQTSQFFGVAGLTYRHFISDDIALSMNGSYVYRSPIDDSTEEAGMIVLSSNYYQRLGEGMFIAPGLGLGGIFGDRNVPQESGLIASEPFQGAVLRLQLPIVLYAWDKFNVFGGPEALFTFASTSPEQGEGVSFFRLDAGFSVGASMYF